MPEISFISTEPLNPTYAYVGAFVDELRRAGLRHAVICPGSRSTPLALVLASTPTIRCWMHVDERSAAFFALGLAKGLDQPVALLCTSGTAAANFLPAIAEAHLTHIPLLVLTSDRPPELRDCGAPQAIDQNHLYGTHVKWFMETALPEASNEALRYIRTIACRALAQTQMIPVGPVHLNMPFREPLTPASLPAQPLPPENTRDALAWHGRSNDQPYIQVTGAQQAAMLTQTELRELATEMRTNVRGLILVGPQTEPALADALLELARKLGYPLLADPLSQLRGRTDKDELIMSSYDAFLRNERFLAQTEPQLILRFGAMPTSKPLLLYLKRYGHCPQIIFNAQQSWEEPTQLAARLLYTDARQFCAELCLTLDEVNTPPANEEAQAERITWLETWRRVDRTTRQTLYSAMVDFNEFFEGRVFSEVAEILPPHSLLYVGNSMPVRDMDTFFWPHDAAPYCLGNRGANGIDGVVSSALGASAAIERDEPAVLVIGDLSFFHDLNGLLAARLHKLNLVIILINNDGGGIFSFLPQAAYPEHFEQLFGTPTGLDFRPVVEMYGGAFQRVTSWIDFRQALQNGLHAGGLRVIELPTERESNVRMHRQLWQKMDQALAAFGEEGV